MSTRLGEQALPFYGLVGFTDHDRVVVDEGWDVNSVAHGPSAASGELIVGVDRRTTMQSGPGTGRVALSEARARESVATVLVARSSDPDQDLYGVAARLAGNGDAWRRCELKVDGEVMHGYEREFQGMWVAYYLTAILIVFVLGPVGRRPAWVELETLQGHRLRRLHSDG
jgi:hypothetical protein